MLRWMHYEYFLFDWDGNLAKTLDVWLAGYQAAFREHGLHLADRQAVLAFGSMEHLGDFLDSLNPEQPIDADEFFSTVDTYALEHLPGADLYPSALDVLAKLHEQGRKKALVTTSHRVYLEKVLYSHGIHEYFDAIITSDDITHAKPHPEPLEKALTAIGGTKNRAVMIGDSEKDLGAAHNFGIDSILFYPPGHELFYDIEALKELKPTHIISDFTEILTIR